MAFTPLPTRLSVNHTTYSLTAATTTTNMSLFKLCPELRLNIYGYLILAEDIYTRPHRPSCPFRKNSFLKHIPLFRTASLPPLPESTIQEQALRAKGELALYDSQKLAKCRLHCRRRTGLAILGVSKVIRDEAYPVFIKFNSFTISDVRDMMKLTRDAPLDRLRKGVKQLTFLEDVQRDTFPVAKYRRFIIALSHLRNIQTIDLPASFAARNGILALGGLLCPSLEKVKLTGITEVHVARDPDDDSDKARTVTLYLKFTYSFAMPKCSRLGHNTWSKQPYYQPITSGIRTCPHCVAYFQQIQRKVIKWYNFDSQNDDTSTEAPNDIVGRALEIMQQILDAKVPTQSVDTDHVMSADVSEYFPGEEEAKEVKAVVLGLPERSTETRTAVLEQEKRYLKGVSPEDVPCCLDEDEKDCTCDCH